MAKWANDNFMDASLTWLQDNGKKQCVLTAQPTLLSQCTASTVLAIVALTTGSFSLANGDASGRKITIAQQATLAVQSTGDASHIAIFSTAAGSSGLHYITTCSAVTLASTNDKVTIPAWDIEVSDPS